MRARPAAARQGERLSEHNVLGTPPGYGQPHGQPSYGQVGRGRAGGWRWEPQPGGIPLRPLHFGEILNGAFTSVQRNRAATLGLSAILLTCSGAISAVLTLAGRAPAAPALGTSGQTITVLQSGVQVTLPVQLALYGLAILVEILLVGLLTTAIGRGVLGRKVSISEAWRIALPRLPALLGVTLLTTLIILCPVAAVVVLDHVLTSGNTNPAVGIVSGFATIAAFILVVWLAVMFSMAAPAVMLERKSPGTALARSWNLVRHSFWRLLGIFLLTLVIVVIAGAVLAVPFSIVAAIAGGQGLVSTGGAPALSVTALIITTVGSIVSTTVTRPIIAGVIVLLYLDTRMRKEGLDLDLQNATAGRQLAGDELETVWQIPPGGPVPGRAASPW
jgi:hypothetical protein